MLQFDANATKKNAVYIETVNTASGAYDAIGVVFSQSYDNSNSIGDATVISTPTIYRNWLIISNLGSTVPTASGQYDVEIWTRAAGEEGRWGFTDAVWSTTTGVWNSFGDAGALVEKIYEDRAYVVGTNESSITQYLSPDENGTYTTYNG
jgi:hypothetical protein